MALLLTEEIINDLALLGQFALNTKHFTRIVTAERLSCINRTAIRKSHPYFLVSS